MSSKSKKPSPTVVPKPRYAIGQRVFIITDHRAIPENIFEAKVVSRSAHEIKLHTIPGEKPEFRTTFGYELNSDSDLWRSRFGSVPESDLYPSYTEAAKVFAKAFLKPLK